MAGPTNPFWDAMNRVVEDFRALREKAAASDAIPFGQERIPPRMLRARLEQMTPDQRRAMMADPTMRERIIDAIRKTE